MRLQNYSIIVCKEIKYLIELLEIITIQKEITTDVAETYIEQLELYSQCENFTEKDKFALFFFKLKREFKLGIYTKQNNTIIETAKDYYEGCIHKNLTDNTDDWLGRICSCYALLIKATQGNEAALEIFENILKIFPDSFDLRREYFSHLACHAVIRRTLKSFQKLSRNT